MAKGGAGILAEVMLETLIYQYRQSFFNDCHGLIYVPSEAEKFVFVVIRYHRRDELFWVTRLYVSKLGYGSIFDLRNDFRFVC